VGLLLSVLAAPVLAATPGFVEDFSAGSAGFTGGSTVTHVTSGGVGGAADPYISISNAAPSNLGAYSTNGNLIGNLPADGVFGYSFWLRDTGADNNLEIHVGIGIPSLNFWETVQGFTPPDGSWQKFSVDVTNPALWVRIIGSGTFQAAVASSGRLLFRHDVPPLSQNPNPVAGDFGLDRIQVLGPPTVPAVSAAGRVALAMLLCAVVVLGVVRRSGRRSPA
jgi:hypothetical protein